jgi:hypothetical protein
MYFDFLLVYNPSKEYKVCLRESIDFQNKAYFLFYFTFPSIAPKFDLSSYYYLQ